MTKTKRARMLGSDEQGPWASLDDGTTIRIGDNVQCDYEGPVTILGWDEFGVDVLVEEDGVQVSAGWPQLRQLRDKE